MSTSLKNTLKSPLRFTYRRIFHPFIKQYFRPKLTKSNFTSASKFSRDTASLLESLQKQYYLQCEPLNSTPIFILGTGWRTGSTLLQRLVISSGQVLIWGEPYSDTRPIPALLSHIRAFRPNYPFPGCFKTISPDELTSLSNQWIAYFFPPVQSLYDAHRSFLLNLFEKPAFEQGFKHWGIKDVRLDMNHARYLKWLFPKAKFIFLTRNPLDAFQSYKGNKWHIQWPDLEVSTASEFAKFWTHLTESFLDGYSEVDGILLRYEDLINSKESIDKIENYLDLKLDRNVLEHKVKGPNNFTERKVLSRWEKFVIKRITDSVANRLNYGN